MNIVNIMLRDKPKRQAKASPFILKLSKILDISEHQDLISWTPCNTAFVVHKPYEFSSRLLPEYFRHNNYGSFLRQLNFYSFVKNKSPNDAVHQFQHPLFVRGEEEQFVRIKRQRQIEVESRDIENQEQGIDGQGLSDSADKELFEKQIVDLKRSQDKLLKQGREMIEQGIETMQWGLIRSAEVEDDSSHNQIICNKISDLIDRYPQLAEHLSYFDTSMINKLLGHLDDNYTTHFPASYQGAFNKFFRMVENNDIWVVMETMQTAYALEKKKGKSFTIVNQKQLRPGHEAQLPFSESVFKCQK